MTNGVDSCCRLCIPPELFPLGDGCRAALLADLCAKRREHCVSDTEMEIFDDLHVVGGDNQAQVAKMLQVAALKSGETDGEGARLPGHLERVEHVRRVSAPADRECNVIGPHKVAQLLGKDIFITRVVGPCRHQRYVVSERQRLEALRGTVGCTLSKIADE